MPEEKITIVYDIDQRKVGCALLQAMAGVSQDYNKVIHLFDNWETSPTDGMKLISGTLEQWKALAEKVNKEKANDNIHKFGINPTIE